MSTLRLNGSLRERLLRLIVDKGMEQDEAALLQLEHGLADEAYTRVFSTQTQLRMNELPAGWMPERDSIQVNITDGRNYFSLHFDGESGDRRFPDSMDRCALSLDSGDELAKRIVKYGRDKDKLKAKRRKLQTDVKAVLGSVTTIKRLLEVWPEAREFTEQLDLTPPQLPALPIRDLNRQLGLAA